MDVVQSTNSAQIDAGGGKAFSFFYRDRVNSATPSNCHQTPVERLGSKIVELLEYIKDRTNVHGEIKKLARSIDTAYNLALTDFTASSKMAQNRTVKTTQTSPGMSVQADTPSTPNLVHQEPNPKKRQLSTPSPASGHDPK
ncbi:hypothetical protein KQX54_013863, partial [Cotesia glomerata]